MPVAISIPSSKTETSPFPDNKFIDALEQVFVNMYTCANAWSAWRTRTMKREDFIPFDRNDELFIEFKESLKEAYLKTRLNEEMLDMESLIMDTLNKEELDLLFNKDIHNKFYENRFIPMTCAKTDISPIILMISDYQLENTLERKINEQRKAKKKVRMVA